MIPHERSLVEKWKNRPFALLGVNSDNTSTEKGMKLYREKQKEMGVTWRSFRNENDGQPISDEWRVSAWPTLFYIDHEGVIRHKDLHGEAAMEKALEEMIAAAEAAAKK
jgi:thiol-disulfide isomerase/thioredoxin